MKIIKIKISEKSPGDLRETMQDHCLYLFRSPMIFTAEGTDRPFAKGCAVLYESGVPREFRTAAANVLNYDLVQFRLSAAERQYISSMRIPLNTPVEIKDSFIISSALKMLDIQWNSSASRKNELGELYMRIILIDLERCCCGDQLQEKHIRIPKYNQLKELRDAVYSDPVRERTVEDVCDWLNVSRSYFHRLYTNTFGVTFRQDVIESRLAYAARLLRTTDMSVSAAAEECGYESDAYFMRQFRQHYGCTPTEYRRKTEKEQQRLSDTGKKEKQ